MRTVALEFERPDGGLAALGTDVIFYVDGRWSRATTHRKMRERADEILRRRKNNDLRFVGYTVLGHSWLNAGMVRIP